MTFWNDPAVNALQQEMKRSYMQRGTHCQEVRHETTTAEDVPEVYVSVWSA